MKKIMPLTFGLLFLIFLTFGCSSNKGPSENEIEKTLAVHMPAFINIASFKIEASQDVGTEVDPLYQTRFRASLQINADTFLEQRDEGNVLFVLPVKKKGENIEVYGRAESKLYAGSWQNSLKLDGSPLRNIGVPLSMFNSPNIIIKGSPEEKEYKAEQQRLAEERIQAEKKRFDRRQKAVHSAFSDGSILKGEASSRKDNWPFILTIKSFDASDGKWAGEMKWITLNAVHKVEGTIIGTMIRFKETDFIKKGNAIIGCVYNLDMDDNEIRLTGTWECNQKGNVWINMR
ncbi:hypothetical protein [Desulfoluna spongiiphila]|uniref:Lipoprotein n=1 Tax=Desulfoluna spongiiphila TaxID=419481 RepID=A0A1G5GZ55_9BACT|nr:hypothetical protein [Desulfoluna spongiiphila]SCY56816.1 hypothetical protein SAMN05216233_1123 [Desulfoluna spongiiphila]